MPPVHVEPPRTRVELDHDVVGNGGIDDLRKIHVVTFTAQQQASRDVAQHGRMRILNRPDDPRGHVGGRLGKRRVNRHDHVIQRGQHRVVKIQSSVRQNIALGAGENVGFKTSRSVQRANLRHLRRQPFLPQSFRLHTGFGMIRDTQILPSQRLRRRGHFNERITPVGRRRVVVKGPAQIRELHQLR